MKPTEFLIATKLLLVMTLVCGGLYPLLVTGIAQLAFAESANGSLVRNDKGEPIGSSLIAQRFRGEDYFWPRPSAGDFSTVPSGASNKGPTSADLKASVDAQRIALQKTASLAGEAPPAELLLASASGLDRISARARRAFRLSA
nr:potassium-transporting ATPase subunit C [Turneriella parva]